LVIKIIMGDPHEIVDVLFIAPQSFIFAFQLLIPITHHQFFHIILHKILFLLQFLHQQSFQVLLWYYYQNYKLLL
jgi:hypothetical protein